MENNFYIFTEIVNCGKIGTIAIDSFHKHHNHAVHIYGTKTDFKLLKPHKNNILIEVGEDIVRGYEKGHIGTALLWEQVIKECPSAYMIHFDSDVIFRNNVIDGMIEKSKEYDLIGPIRNYHHNPHGIVSKKYPTDVCQTNCTLFNRELISHRYLKKNRGITFPSLKTLCSISFFEALRRITWAVKNTILLREYHLSTFAQMIHGTYNPFIFPTIDFFDPVMFDMFNNGAKILHLDFDDVGGCNEYGSRDNRFKEINNFPTPYKIDFGRKLVHFSCVGSGMNFYSHPETTRGIGKHYVECALDRYALFCKIFYNEALPEISLEKYRKILGIKDWY